jgi:hypothetical protein
MGGPDMAPHTPPALGAPRRSRGAPRIPSHPLRTWGPDMAPKPPNARDAPAEPWRPSTSNSFTGSDLKGVPPFLPFG